jgi:UDP-glucose 4-epimerase
MINNLLVPGGLGFIGSHTIIELFNKNKSNIIIVDDMSNCYDDVLDRMKLILSKTHSK